VIRGKVDDMQYRGEGGEDGGKKGVRAVILDVDQRKKGVHAVILDVDQRCAQERGCLCCDPRCRPEVCTGKRVFVL
jgi:hypothetical protein